MSSLDAKWEQIQYTFQSKKARALVKDLVGLITTGQASIQNVGDMIAELLKRDAEWMMKKLYPAIRFRKKFNASDLDEYIVKKYCLAPGEEILDKFHVYISEGKVTTNGIAYLTNVRIIVEGNQVVRSAQKGYGRSPSGILGAAMRSKVTHKRQNMRAAISKALRTDMQSVNVLEWGYSFPMVNAHNIKRGKNNISYLLIIETEKKPQRLAIKIKPSRLKKMPKAEWASKLQKILDQIEDILHHYQ